MKFFTLIIPVIFLFSFLFAAVRKVRVYDSFAEGVKGAIPLVMSVFPYIATVMMLTQLFSVSGLEDKLTALLAPLFERLGIPKEISSLVLVKPLSGNGSTAVLSDILARYGPDSYVSRCACVAYGSSETVFYIGSRLFLPHKAEKIYGRPRHLSPLLFRFRRPLLRPLQSPVRNFCKYLTIKSNLTIPKM